MRTLRISRTTTVRAGGRRQGRTLVPLRLYFNDKGLAKLDLALARGKRTVDKRAAEAERDWKREQGRLMREKG